MTDKPTCATCKWWTDIFTLSGETIMVCSLGRPSNWVKTKPDHSCRDHKLKDKHHD